VSALHLPGDVAFTSVESEATFLAQSQRHWDGVVLLGSHAAEGTPAATLSHTMSIKNPQVWHVNGVDIGETGIQALMFSVERSPIMMVTGGACLANEIALWCPTARHVTVKWDEGWNRAKSRSEEEATRMIREAASSLIPLPFEELPVKSPYLIERCQCGGSLGRVFLRTAWACKRMLQRKPPNGAFRIMRGSIAVQGDDPRILINALV